MSPDFVFPYRRETIPVLQWAVEESDDWKLVDGMDLIVHIFNPEKRKFYDLEKMWSEFLPKERLMI